MTITKTKDEATIHLIRHWTIADDRPTRRLTKRRLARQTKATRERAAAKETAATEPEPTEDLPLLSWWKRWGRLGHQCLWGPISPSVPYHVTTLKDIGLLTPFLAAPTDLMGGPAIGNDTFSSSVWNFDPWEAYVADLVTSPGACVWGTMGTGKSYCVKCIMVRLVAFGRHVIVENDPKGEWAPIAEKLGGQVITLGPGARDRVNPMDAPPIRKGTDEKAQTSAHRGKTLRSIVSILRDGKPFTDQEQTCLDYIVADMGEGLVTASIPGIISYLDSQPKNLIDRVGPDAVHVLSLVFGRLTLGPLAGIFDGESTVELDPAAPMVAIDTSLLENADSQTKALAAACISAWVDCTLRCGDGRWRVVVSEEGWAQLRDQVQATAMEERLRMAGHWRVSCWLVFHELEDAAQMGESDSAHRAIVRGIISKSAIKIIYQQKPENLPLLADLVGLTPVELTEVTGLAQGEGLWRVGDVRRIIRPVASASADALFSTSANRAG